MSIFRRRPRNMDECITWAQASIRQVAQDLADHPDMTADEIAYQLHDLADLLQFEHVTRGRR